MPSPMRSIFSLIGSLFFAFAAQGADLKFPTDVKEWQAIAIPSEDDRSARMAWFYAANYSTYEWNVFADRDRVQVKLDSTRHQSTEQRPAFDPHVGTLHGASSFSRVGDGWLVGFNHGEWGGALYWFSSDGKQNYKVSDHQIVRFFGLADGLYAIEGLAHMTMSEGSIIRISRGSERLRWRADTFTKLPFAPYAVSVRQDNTMLVTLSDALVSIDSRGKLKTLLTNPPWIGLYPNSSVVSADGQKLYIGMRQFVEEIDLQTTKSRLLIPSVDFLNKLPAEDEQRIRSQYGS